MRFAALVIAIAPTLFVANVATAAPSARRIGIVHGARIVDAVNAGTSFAHVIYLNRCAPNGCTVTPGDDDSRTDRSSIPQQVSHIAAYPWGDDSWNQFVQCVKTTYAPFDVTITDQDPGTAAHFELMVGGNSTDVQVEGALGVAPFIPCGGVYDNVVTFVFAAETTNIDELCWAAAQETSHALGLDHELDAKDPMTYLSPPIHKEFQNSDAKCGEDTARECYCGGTTQNSVKFLSGLLGEATPTPPTVEITAPKNGAWVPQGFPVAAKVTSISSVSQAAMEIDGASSGTATGEPWTFNAPQLAPGPHAVTVSAINASQLSGSSEVMVYVMATCAPGCGDGTVCLGGNCVPDGSHPGGLGGACSDTSACAIGTCGKDGGGNQFCTASCDAGNVCPSGFACTATSGGAGVCWPAPETGGGGGCDASGAGGGWLAVGLVAIAFARRRRAARA